MSEAKVFFKAPVDFAGNGLFIGGGFHAVAPMQHKGDTVLVLALPAEGNWGTLGALGYVEVSATDLQPVAVASD